MRLSSGVRKGLLRTGFVQIPPDGLRRMLKAIRRHPRKVLLDGRISAQGGLFCPIAWALPGVERADWISVLLINPGWRRFDWDPKVGPHCFQDALAGSTLAEVKEEASKILRQKMARKRARTKRS